MKPTFAIVKRAKWWDLINYFYIIKAKLDDDILIYVSRYHHSRFQ